MKEILPASSYSKNNVSKKHLQLSEHLSIPEKFSTIESAIASLRSPSFLSLSVRKRFRFINEMLYQLINEAPLHSFLLSAVLDFFERVSKENVLVEPLNFAYFEFWLNNFSGLDDEANYEVRAKIAGKYIPRHDYQVFFPIGMGRIYQGTHFVAAHLSPDVDTMIASFWGWVDAFAARIGTGLHFWCLPGGPPDSPFTSIFREMFGTGLFSYLARIEQTLTLTAADLLAQKHFVKEIGGTLISSIDSSTDRAVILIDEQGHYLGDWRSSDVELVRQIIIPFKSCLHWFENNLHTKLIAFLAQEHVSAIDLKAFSSNIFDFQLKNCEPVLDFNEKQTHVLHDFFHKILGVENGLNGTFRDLNKALAKLNIFEMLQFQKDIESLESTDLFDQSGKLVEDRPRIFNCLQDMINRLDEAILNVRNYVERLDVVLGIKHLALGLPRAYLTLKSDVDEIRQKIQDYDFLTVVIHEQDHALFPVGIVRARDLRESGLGTVSLRDFSNLEEVKMASYLEVISIVDHHKSTLRTLSVPTAIIGDAQSCNVILAELAFALNDKYSTNGMILEEINIQIQDISSHLTTPSQLRLLQRLLQRRLVAQTEGRFYIHPKREFNEYLCFLQAILDDTDLLTKVSARDLDCVAQLLNRLKSLLVGEEVEIISFDDIPRDKTFVKTAAKTILQQEDMYSLYKKIYSFRESEVESNLGLCIDGHYSNIFLDAKEQNGCARVGQTKLFSSNFTYFLQHADEIRTIWLQKSREVYDDQHEIDLHIHMISTIASADEVYKDQIGPYSHQDQLWFWIPSTQQGYRHLNSFLTGFQHATKELQQEMLIEFRGPFKQDYTQVFKHHFPNVPQETITEANLNDTVVILYFKAGALNSRKAMVTPFLPRLIS